MGAKLPLELFKLRGERFVAGEHFSHAGELAHDLDVDRDGALTVQDRIQHRYALLGERVGSVPAATRPAFDVTICDLKCCHSVPPIWRSVDVYADTTLKDLHDVIQAAMGWESAHLYQFEIGGGLMDGPGFGMGSAAPGVKTSCVGDLVEQGVERFPSCSQRLTCPWRIGILGCYWQLK